MSNAVAVILAAGMGTRLGPLTQDMPKGLLPMEGRAILLHSVDRLRAAGITRIRVVTGHRGDRFERALGGEAGVELCENPDYAHTGSLQSLLVGLHGLESHQGPVLILESDLVYESRAIPELLSGPSQILASGPTGAGDEVYVWAEQTQSALPQLSALSKERGHLSMPPMGELTGLNAISAGVLEAFMAVCHRVQAARARSDYESAMVEAARKMPLGVRLLEDLVWAEIDDAGMLARVERQVWPEITQRDGALLA